MVRRGREHRVTEVIGPSGVVKLQSNPMTLRSPSSCWVVSCQQQVKLRWWLTVIHAQIKFYIFTDFFALHLCLITVNFLHPFSKPKHYCCLVKQQHQHLTLLLWSYWSSQCSNTLLHWVSDGTHIDISWQNFRGISQETPVAHLPLTWMLSWAPVLSLSPGDTPISAATPRRFGHNSTQLKKK